MSRNRENDWSKAGSFMKKPKAGWLHTDNVLTDGGGVCYMIRYIGCVPVLRSMRTLQFDVRTQVTREAVIRIMEAAGLKQPDKKRKVPKNVSKALGSQPVIDRTGTNMNFTISVDGLELSVVETAEVVAHHAMPSISFASSGEGLTQGYLAYVAKDPIHDRACHVFDCQDIAQEVISSIGQAFELRYKAFLNQPPPQPMQPVPRFGSGTSDTDAWGSDEHAYSDAAMGGQGLQGRRANDALPSAPHFKGRASDGLYDDLPEGTYDNSVFGGAGRSPGMVYDNPQGLRGKRTPMTGTEGGVYDNPNALGQVQQGGLYDNPKGAQVKSSVHSSARKPSPQGVSQRQTQPPHHSSGAPYDKPRTDAGFLYDNPQALKIGQDSHDREKLTYDNKDLGQANGSALVYDNKEGVGIGGGSKKRNGLGSHPPLFDDDSYSDPSRLQQGSKKTPFDMSAVGKALTAGPSPGSLEAEEWFHGQMSRVQAEGLLEEDGEFLVRESTSQAGQYVLTGMQDGKARHMLLVDPEGVVRTKDRVFSSVQHLIKFHRENGMPIVSNDSSVMLKQSVIASLFPDD